MNKENRFMEDYVCLANMTAYFLMTVGHTFNNVLAVIGYVLVIICILAECVLLYRKVTTRDKVWRILCYIILNAIGIALPLV